MGLATATAAATGAKPPTPLAKGIGAAGATGRWSSFWGVAGFPVAGTWNATLDGVTCTGATTGALPRSNPDTGSAYLYSLATTAGSTSGTPDGILMVLDRIWHNGGISIATTSPQAITSPTWPSRCPTSASDDTPSTSGHGVLLGVEVSAALGAGGPTVTVDYTNSAGTSGRTGAGVITLAASSPLGALIPIGLQAGDAGVRSVQSLTLSGTIASGSINLVAFRILAAVPVSVAASFMPRYDWYSLGNARVYDDACLFFAHAHNAASNPGVLGQYAETHG